MALIEYSGLETFLITTPPPYLLQIHAIAWICKRYGVKNMGVGGGRTCYYVPMRYLGIDYGTKRIGLAISDEGGTMAFPYAILENSKGSLGEIKTICAHESVETIIIGESVDYKGMPNLVKKEIDRFIIELRKLVDIPVIEEREFLTTQQARFYQTKRKRVDDSAAAIILQSYLDRKNIRPILETL